MSGGPSEVTLSSQRLVRFEKQAVTYAWRSWNIVNRLFLYSLLSTTINHILPSAPFTRVMMGANSITVIFSPYHVGIRDHRVGDGPNRIRAMGVFEELKKLDMKVHILELPPVDGFEGEIGRSFEILRRTSEAVTDVCAKQSFSLVLSGNCMASAGVACGLGLKDLGWIYFDARRYGYTID